MGLGSRYQGAAVSSPPPKLGAPRQLPLTCLTDVYFQPKQYFWAHETVPLKLLMALENQGGERINQIKIIGM